MAGGPATATPGGGGGGMMMMPEQPPAEAPPNNELKDRIDKMAEYYIRNGPRFEQMTLMKQGDNPMFQFLKRGNAEHRYYRWRIYSQQANLSTDDIKERMAVLRNFKFPTNPPPSLSDMNDEKRVAEILSTLTIAKESIKSSRKALIQLLEQSVVNFGENKVSFTIVENK
eukprot:jgi/Bigna1/146561/aug1.117_g21269